VIRGLSGEKDMTRLLICAIAVLLGYDQAFAADLVEYSAPTAPSAFVWTGFHVGISGGFGSNQDNATYSYVNVPSDVISLLPQSAKLDADGGLVGGSVGFDKQFGQIVLGVEGDLSWTGFDDNAIHLVAGDPSIGFPPLKFETDYDMEWLSTIRGRAGVAFDNWVLYGTAGVAFGRISLDSSVAVSDFGSLTGSKETTKTGWIAGGGGAVAVTPHISLKAEALYYDLGDITVASTNRIQDVVLFTDQDVKGVIVRGGLDYRF
jgi:outer membrane immunogenic protein